jgi:hypothetical protein
VIESYGTLLDELRRKELAILAKYGILKHPSLIGNMYEGLTKDLLRRSLFCGCDLHVLDGKIRGADERLSDQIDCMVTTAAGEHIPYTTSRIVDIVDVVAVLEVKKNLYRADLSDAFEHLLSVPFPELDPRTPLTSAARAFRLIARQDASIDNLRRLDREKQMLFSCLASNSIRPLRIILGYIGYKTEAAFREAVLTILFEHTAHNEQGLGTPGFGPSGLPNLLLCREHAIVKCDALPYYVPLVRDFQFPPEGVSPEDWWLVYGSTTERSGRVLLELLWTRLRQKFNIPLEVFGDDLSDETLRPLLFAKPFPKKGWIYSSFPVPVDQCDVPRPDEDWVPTFLDEAQFVVVQLLCLNEELDINDDQLLNWLGAEHGDSGAFAKRLTETGLVCENAFGKLVLLTAECRTAVLPDGSYVAGEDVSGRFTRWLQAYAKRHADRGGGVVGPRAE